MVAVPSIGRATGVVAIFHDRIRDDDEAVALILSVNITRRHLSAGQRAMATAFAYPKPARVKRAGSSVAKEQIASA